MYSNKGDCMFVTYKLGILTNSKIAPPRQVTVGARTLNVSHFSLYATLIRFPSRSIHIPPGSVPFPSFSYMSKLSTNHLVQIIHHPVE